MEFPSGARRRGWLPAFWMMTWSWAIATPMTRRHVGAGRRPGSTDPDGFGKNAIAIRIDGFLK